MDVSAPEDVVAIAGQAVTAARAYVRSVRKQAAAAVMQAVCGDNLDGLSYCLIQECFGAGH